MHACWVLQNCAALVDFMAKHTIKQSGKTQCHIKLKKKFNSVVNFSNRSGILLALLIPVRNDMK